MIISIEPVGVIHSERKDPIDDNWDAVRSWIELNDDIPEESIAGLESFSHIEVLYYFHKVDQTKIVVGSEHPRENPDWPRVGIFAQRKKSRPNLLGATIAKIVKIEGRKIYVKCMDAIDGTPVIDIKPVFSQYLPNEEIRQPEWVNELMKEYW